MSTKPRLLFVDDEERILRSLTMLFKNDYDVVATTKPFEALQIVQQEKIHVIVSDQRMPVMTGAELLREVRRVAPNTMRLLLTGYSELDAIISSVNDGEVFRYINKPWSSREIREIVSKAASIAISLADISEKAAAVAGQAADVKPVLRVLVIDDDEQTVLTVQEILGSDHVVRWGATMEEAFSILSSEDTAIVVSEVKIGKEDVTSSLKLLKQQHPGIITIVTTSFQDTGTIIGLINEGQVFRFLPKPVRRGLMGISLQSAVRHYHSLKIVPELALRHAVEIPAKPDAIVPNRILTYLSRIRGRNAGTEAGS